MVPYRWGSVFHPLRLLKEESPIMPIVKHHVAFSPTRGVYLGMSGKPLFGKDEGATAERNAPTFHDQAHFDKHKEEFARDQPFPDDIQLCEVWPDKAGEEASAEAVRAVGLPVWPAPKFKPM